MWEELKQEVCRENKRLPEYGLVVLTWGNVSARTPDGEHVIIKPSGVDYASMTPEQMVVTDLQGNIVEGDLRPSSDLATHLEIYRSFPEVGGVVHTHSPYCTTFAVLNEPIRAVHYAIAGAGVNEIPCAPYCTFGTELLAERAVRYCGRGNAVLLGNHGVVCCGESLEKAYALAGDLEFTARLQYQARCIGTPRVLTEDEMAAALERFQTYGQQPKR